MDTHCICHGQSLGITVQGAPKEIWSPTTSCFPYTLGFPASVLLSISFSPGTIFLLHVHVVLIFKDQFPYRLFYEVLLSFHSSSLYSSLHVSPTQDMVALNSWEQMSE